LKTNSITYATYYISTYSEINNFYTIHVCYLYDFSCPRPTIPTCGATCSSVPLWPFLVSIHGVTFTMADGTMYFILNLIEVTEIVHIIVVTLLHIVHLVVKALLLLTTLSQFSRGHIRYIVASLV
jgi:hypothetical protein